MYVFLSRWCQKNFPSNFYPQKIENFFFFYFGARLCANCWPLARDFWIFLWCVFCKPGFLYQNQRISYFIVKVLRVFLYPHVTPPWRAISSRNQKKPEKRKNEKSWVPCTCGATCSQSKAPQFHLKLGFQTENAPCLGVWVHIL